MLLLPALCVRARAVQACTTRTLPLTRPMTSIPTSPSLAQGSCEPCRKESLALSSADTAAFLADLNQAASPSSSAASPAFLQPEPWAVQERHERGITVPALERTFLFRTFRHALAFTNAVGAEAEREGHHPALLTEWGSVKVAWWTHAIGGLHRNDFIMAAKTDAVFQKAEGKKKAPGSSSTGGTTSQ